MSYTETGYRNSANNNVAVEIPVNSLSQSFGYVGSTLTTITVVYRDITFVQTLIYTGSNLTNLSPWQEPE